MALKKFVFNTTSFRSFVGCETVGVCLDASWAAKTVSGQPLILATVENSGRPLGDYGYESIPQWLYTRSDDKYQYTLSYDDTQITDPVTDVVTCEDVNNLIDACTVNVMLSIAAGGGSSPWTSAGGYLYMNTLTDDVGIGTATPATKLHVFDTAPEVRLQDSDAADATAASPGITLYDDTDLLGFLRFQGGSDNLFLTATTNAGELHLGTQSTTRLRITNDNNLGLLGSTDFGSGTQVIGVADATVAPTVNPIGGGVLYSDSGALTWRGSSGTVTVIAPA